MAKKKKQNKSGFDFVTAVVNEDGISFRYRVTGLKVDGRDNHDEDGSGDWPDDDIRKLGCSLIGMDEKFMQEIDVQR